MQGGFETQPSRLAPLLSCEVLQARVLVIACHGWLWRRRFTLVRCKPFFSAATAFLSLWVLRRYALQREQLRLLAVARLLDGAVTQWKHQIYQCHQLTSERPSTRTAVRRHFASLQPDEP